jgi:branched-chain amino acid transport system permease protein
MPSFTLLGQSLLSGIFIGSLYALMGLGVSLSWGYLRLINLAHFALAFLGAYLTYQLSMFAGFHPAAAVLVVAPLFFMFGMLMQLLFARFNVSEFSSLLVTFGITVIIEAGIQYFWTADFRRLQFDGHSASWRLGPLYLPVDEVLMLVVAVVLTVGTWAWLRFTYMGKAMRASTENPAIAAAFGVDHKKLSVLLSGVSAAYAGVAGGFIAVLFTLSPAQIFSRMGVIFAVVILGGLGNPLGILFASLVIGISEAITMAVTQPAWAPLVSFTLLIAVLLLRPGKV